MRRSRSQPATTERARPTGSLTVSNPYGYSSNFIFDVVSVTGDGWSCSTYSCTTDAVIPAGGTSSPITMVITPRSSYAGVGSLQASISGGGDGITGNGAVSIDVPFPATATRGSV